MALQLARKVEQSTGFKFLNEGDSIHGYYQGQLSKTINGSPAIEHTYRTASGVVSVLGQANILTQIKQNDIAPGTYVEIVFTGKMQRLKNGRTMKVYDVSFDRDNFDASVQLPSEEVYEADDSEDESSDEVAPPAPVAPRQPASLPSADRKAQMQALLRGGKKSGV